ncbi:acetyltransferase [Candidatus Omnitrophota bacterium]
MKGKIVLLGGGGHCKVVMDAIRKEGKYKIAGIVDPGLNPGDTVMGVKVLGGDNMLELLKNKGIKYAIVTVGSLGDSTLRKALSEEIIEAGLEMPVVIHPSAVVADDVEIGPGTFVAPSVTINPGTKIGHNAIINTSSSVDHDCEIGDFVHIAPGVTLSGGVKVGDSTHIGTGAKVVQYVDIGRDSFIAAGVLVKSNLPEGCRIKSGGEYDGTI